MSSIERLLGRFLQGVLVVFIASSLSLFLVKSLPGDQFSQLLRNPDLSPEQVARVRENFGDNSPWLRQYWHWITSLLHGNLLNSTSQHESVAAAISRAVPPTLFLMGLAFTSSILFGTLLGTWQATHQGSVGERLSAVITFCAFSLPDFWIAMLLQLIFAIKLGWLPSVTANDFGEYGSIFDRVRASGKFFVLPWLSLTIVDTAVFSRYQRASAREVMGQQFLQTARAKGVGERAITWKHTLRVSLIPMISLAGVFFPSLFVGAILIESIFNRPGVGSLLLTAINERDYFLVSGIVVFGSIMTALGSFLADVLREIADPRLRA